MQSPCANLGQYAHESKDVECGAVLVALLLRQNQCRTHCTQGAARAEAGKTSEKNGNVVQY